MSRDDDPTPQNERRRTIVIIIDETGPLSVEDNEGNVFAIGASIVDNPEQFAFISRIMRKARGAEEIKYARNKRIREVMEKYIAATGIEVIGVYVKKDEDAPLWWKIIKKRSWPQRLMLRELSRDLVNLNKDFDMIIIDEDTVWKNRIKTNDEGKKIIERYVKTKRRVGHITQEDSKTGTHRDLLQTNDFAVGAMGRVLRGECPPTPIKIRARRLVRK